MTRASAFTTFSRNWETRCPVLPLVLHWREPDNPLPIRVVRSPGRRTILDLGAPPWLDTGATDQPFDFCRQMRRLTADVASRCPELHHVDVSRLLFGVTQARSGRAHGLQARVTPMRFRNGSLLRRRRGVVYQVQRYFVEAREMYYLITFCLPRFLDLDLIEKFVTLFHELYHFSPSFDGDLRRHGGRYSIHSHSQKSYDRHMAQLARAYLAGGADPALHAFLRLNFSQLQQRHGSITGVVVPRPKLVPIPEPIISRDK